MAWRSTSAFRLGSDGRLRAFFDPVDTSRKVDYVTALDELEGMGLARVGLDTLAR